ncbi:hypothetical protein [Lentzea albida]|uniref:Bacteriocin, lactococcin 972 family n=1 Tax=Lentzea albida TaxID=65499 RepID=A0A1H9GSG4_9PSEU|nr:hypothetical protein [Lentzea albida]SEQ53005.1 hypothetical protein SAMN04488000_103255 [Lentzea albida]
MKHSIRAVVLAGAAICALSFSASNAQAAGYVSFSGVGYGTNGTEAYRNAWAALDASIAAHESSNSVSCGSPTNRRTTYFTASGNRQGARASASAYCR